MRKLIITFAALALPACAALTTAATVTQAIATNRNTVEVPAVQALIVANNAYQGAAALAEVAVKSGKLTPDQLATVSRLNDQAIAILETAETATNQAEKAAELMNVVNSLNAVIGKGVSNT